MRTGIEKHWTIIDGLPHGQSGRVPRAPEPIGALGLQSFFFFFGTIFKRYWNECGFEMLYDNKII